MSNYAEHKQGEKEFTSGDMPTETIGLELLPARLLDGVSSAAGVNLTSLGKVLELVHPVVTLEARNTTEERGCCPSGALILSTWNDSSSSSLVKHLFDMETTKRNLRDTTTVNSRGVARSPRAD